MSADNYYLVRRHPQGGFTPLMGFASDERTPLVRESDKSYPTAEEALSVVINEYSEYGASIHPECARSPYRYNPQEAHQAFLHGNQDELEALSTYVEDLLNHTEAAYESTLNMSELNIYLNGWRMFEQTGKVITNVSEDGSVTLSDPYDSDREQLVIPTRVLDGTTSHLDWAHENVK